ncbi:hypothetical protein CPAR01_16059, partial [Colletotrichum paranaense]
VVTLYPRGWSWLRCLCAFPDTEVRRVRRVETILEGLGSLDERSRGGRNADEMQTPKQNTLFSVTPDVVSC